jgi:hypothetical protein
LERPKGFTFLSLFLAYVTFTGIAKGLQLASVYGSIPGILGFIYGLSAMVAAYGLWFYRPWAFYAEIIWSISALAWVFNWQYGLNGKYTLPLHFFILYVAFLITLFVLLAFYIKKRIRVLNEGIALSPEEMKNINSEKS